MHWAFAVAVPALQAYPALHVAVHAWHATPCVKKPPLHWKGHDDALPACPGPTKTAFATPEHPTHAGPPCSATTDGAGHPNDAYCPTLHDTVQFAQFWVAFSLKKPALHPHGQLLPVLSAEGPRYTACAFWGLLLHVPLHV